MSDTATGLRLDKWLWFARFARTRSLAARLCEAGAVEIGGKVAAKPNRLVRIGDEVTVPQGRQRHRVVVLALGTRRGPAAEARRLYREDAAPEPIPRLPPDWEPLLADAAGDSGDGESPSELS